MKCPYCDGTGCGALLDHSGNVIGCPNCWGTGDYIGEYDPVEWEWGPPDNPRRVPELTEATDEER